MHVLILGSGLLGTAAAWFIRAAGHEVTVVDRQPASGLETSFANGGQISVSHAEPWANPHAPRQILRWLGRRDAPLLFRWRLDPALWSWGLQFLRECSPARTRHNIRQLVNLGIYSRTVLQALRRETGIQYDHLERGILHFFTREEELEAGIAAAAAMREFGCDSHPVSAQRCLEIEPALRDSRVPVVGGTYTASDESGNAHLFTQRLAQLCAEKGVRFLYSTRIQALEVFGGRVSGVLVRAEDGTSRVLSADAYVMACGSFSAPLLRPLGIRIPVYPAKGYSITLPLDPDGVAPSVSLTDDEQKLVFSRLGGELRVAGTAEFAGYDTSLDQTRCQAIAHRAAQLFPRAGDLSRARFWAGLRPATPGNVPLIGRTVLSNLYLNTGHGTLGWTHSCGSGQALAHILSGRQPEVDFDFLGGRKRSRPLPVDSYGADTVGSTTGTRPEASFTERRAPH
jgi:D-amino-acid dehydrogenase